jgi:hypothetical protein
MRGFFSPVHFVLLQHFQKLFDKCNASVPQWQVLNQIQFSPMSSSFTKSAYLTVRLPSRTRTKFLLRAKNYGTPSEVLRELVDAFVEERMTIQPPVTRKEKMYVTRSED